MSLSVGRRVQVLTDKGTVKYVGRVDNQTGMWVGIEWDDPSRGKHDGSAGGKRYFDCGHPTGASFIRAEKVLTGSTLLEALISRYHNEVGEYGTSAGDEAMYVQTASKRLVKVQLVGLDKIQARQSQLDLLLSARLVGLNISSVVRPPLVAVLHLSSGIRVVSTRSSALLASRNPGTRIMHHCGCRSILSAVAPRQGELLPCPCPVVMLWRCHAEPTPTHAPQTTATHANNHHPPRAIPEPSKVGRCPAQLGPHQLPPV
jgi:hypothetical protein